MLEKVTVIILNAGGIYNIVILSLRKKSKYSISEKEWKTYSILDK